MPTQGYYPGNAAIIPQEISIGNPEAGGLIPLIKVPDGFFMRWVWLHWILNVNTGDATFRHWFINVISPASGDFGQIIPGLAAVGGTGAPNTSPIHEAMDSTLPVFFDEVFEGAAGVKPLWDYSGNTSVWWPPSFEFVLDATNLVAGDQFVLINGLVELIQSEDAGLSDSAASELGQSLGAEAWYLHQG